MFVFEVPKGQRSTIRRTMEETEKPGGASWVKSVGIVFGGIILLAVCRGEVTRTSTLAPLA
jgi:hypothetical protein